MTEAEWLSSTEPGPMLEYLRGRDCVRELRRFACACCRRIWPLLDDEAFRRAVELSEQFTEGRLSKAELNAAAQAAHAAALQSIERWYGPPHAEPHELGAETIARWHPTVAAATAVGGATSTRRFGWVAAYAACVAERHERGEFHAGFVSSHPGSHGTREAAAQAQVLRCIIGNPFRPAALSPASRTPQVVGLARAAHDQRELPAGTLDPTRLAVLADALEDAGCDDAGLLGHLRGPGQHVRGCWVLDLLLGVE